MFSINRHPTNRDLKWFAGGLLVGFPLVAFLLLRWLGHAEDGRFSLKVLVPAVALAVGGIAGGFVTLASKETGRKLYIAWMTATLPIGIAVSTILLSILYFVFLPIFSVIVRRSDPLRRKLGGPTYWEDYKPHEPTLERMRRPF